MSQRLNNLNEIISVLKSGALFYGKAAEQADKDEHRRLFRTHAELRDEAVAELSEVVEAAGGEVGTGSAVEAGMRAATRLGAALGAGDRNLIEGLEEHETRTLLVFHDAIDHEDNAPDRKLLRAYLGRFQAAHDRMSALKEEV